MKDVARAAGVSTATVSAAINGKDHVRPETKARVLEAAESLGYSLNTLAQGLRSQRTFVLGVGVPDITNAFYTELVRAVQREARLCGYSVLLGDSDHDAELETAFIRKMQARRADGLVLAPFGAPGAYDDVRAALDTTPHVLVNNVPDGFDTDAVVIDNHAAGRAATRHLLALGHTRIGLITGPQHTLTGRERLRGAQAAIAEAGLPPDPSLVRITSYRQADAMAACLDLLGTPEPPTAVFAANNHITLGTMRAISARRLVVPRDISVCGVDDFVWAEAFSPRLTTVRQPIGEMAREAVRLLLQRIERRDAPRAKVVFQAEFVERESCAAPPTREP